MEFINKLRNVKEQGKEAAHRALERARESGLSLERHLRQKMRIYPRSLRPTSSNPNLRSQPATVFEEELEETVKAGFHERKPIVSIHGKDIEPVGAEGERRGKVKPDRKIA